MRRFYPGVIVVFGLVLLLFVVSRSEYAGPRSAAAATGDTTTSPYTDFGGETPGKVHHITAADLPAPYATKSAAIFSRPVPRGDAWPQAPAGFKVELYAEKLKVAPRTIITAPNGDMFVAATNQGQVLAFRSDADGKMQQMETFATGLKLPFGLAFYPPGPDPKYLYVGDTDAILRFTYNKGDLKAAGPPETIVANLPSGPNHYA